MSVIRVHKTKDFTVMSNTHLRDKGLSLKAKGLLSIMLSLPDDWDYSIAGLVAICKENETAVKSALNELKASNYVIVRREEPTKENGGRIKYNYEVYEQPQKTKIDKQPIEKQGVENLGVEFQGVENNGQLNTNKLSTDELNTNKQNTERLSTNKVNTSDVSDVRVNTFPVGKGESKKLTRKQLEEKQSDMIKRFNNICDDNLPANPVVKDCVKKVFARYIVEYNNHTDKIHPILKDETLLRIALILAGAESEENSLLSEIETYTPYDGTTMFDDMVDLHFLRKHRQETDWSIVHFANAEYLDKLASGLI